MSATTTNLRNSHRRRGRELSATIALLVGLMSAMAADASPPSTVAVAGHLQTDGGGAVADGDYALTFSVYASQNSQQSLWSESVAKLAVKGGVFRHALGSVKALDPKLLASGSVWLGLRVGGDPELARSQFHGVPFALRAAVADGLACTGCVSLAALKADGDLNLGGNALKSKLISTGSVVAASISANAFVGDGSQLTGIKLPAGACPQGEAAVGIDSTGKLQCASGAAGGTLEQVSGGLLTTKYAQPVVSKTVPKDIEDFNPIGAFDEIIVPDVGTVTTLAVTVQLTNSDLTGVKLVLYDPLNAEHVLFQGGKPGKVLSETWPPSKQVSGDLSTWQGKNAKGKWRLGVIDSKFLKDNKDGKDGKLESWSINLLTNNSKQVTSTGVFLAAGGLQHQLSSGPPFACSGDSIGWMYLDSKDKRLYFCDGDWRKLLIEPLCGNKVINPGETCDDGNVNNGDGCTSKCQKNVCGDGILWPAKEECDDGNKNDADECSSACKFTNCLKDWKVGTVCNGANHGGGCTPQETGYHFKGLYTKNNVKYGCWWHTKNQAWNTTTATNFDALAKQFKLQVGVGGTKWCFPRANDPCASGACESTKHGYFSPTQKGAWGWCGGAAFSSGGFVCIPAGNVVGCGP